MKLLGPVMLLLLAPTAAEAQTIEGFWQDSERRILFDRRAPASYQYGAWTPLDQQQTYPSAKQIRNSGGRFELVDLLYDDEHAIKVVGADDRPLRSSGRRSFPPARCVTAAGSTASSCSARWKTSAWRTGAKCSIGAARSVTCAERAASATGAARRRA